MEPSIRQLLLIGFCSMLSVTSASCSSPPATAEESSAKLDVEQTRVPLAQAALPVKLANIQQVAHRHAKLIAGATDITAIEAQGNALWQQAVQQNQAGLVDDRPLYWQRLASQQQLHRACDGIQCQMLRDRFELASRGAQDIAFTNSGTLKILITGFDPFALDRDITQTNPSGVIALQLDGRRLSFTAADSTTEHQAQVQSLIFPVRFADFDAGMVEQVLTPLLKDNAVDAIITLSMGREGFDLERFPGRRRATTATDNRNRQTGASAANPLVPLLNGNPLQGPEFVEFSLPVVALVEQQAPYSVVDNRKVRTLEDGEFSSGSLAELKSKTAVAGSGGTYLSNEISYRSVLLSQSIDPTLPVGHIHLPRLTGYDEQTLVQISAQLEQMLSRAIPALSRRLR